MQIKITGSPKEIAALVLEIQERQKTVTVNTYLDGKSLSKLERTES